MYANMSVCAKAKNKGKDVVNERKNTMQGGKVN